MGKDPLFSPRSCFHDKGHIEKGTRGSSPAANKVVNSCKTLNISLRPRITFVTSGDYLVSGSVCMAHGSRGVGIKDWTQEERRWMGLGPKKGGGGHGIYVVTSVESEHRWPFNK